MGDRKAARPNIVGGTIFTIAGILIELYAFGFVLADRPHEYPWLIAVLGLLGLLPGACFLILGFREMRPQTAEARKRDEVAVGCTLAVIVVTIMAILLTAVAVFSWQPDPSGRFFGGITGTMWEHRIVWTLTAGLFDAVALFVWWAIAMGVVRSATDRR
jgi:hypothetical protein